MQYEFVLHEGGFKVATDGTIVVAIREGYPSVLENKLLSKDNVVIDRKSYPKWEAVYPLNLEDFGFPKYKISQNKFKVWLADVRRRHQEKRGKKINYDSEWYVHIGNAYFSAQQFARIIKAMKILGADELTVIDPKYGDIRVFTETEEGWMIAMALKEVVYENIEDNVEKEKIFQI